MRGPEARVRFIAFLLIAVSVLLVMQLVRIQVLDHPLYRKEAKALVERHYALPDPPWGLVIDRHGDLLVGNMPVYDVGAEVDMVHDPVGAAERLAPYLHLPQSDLVAALTMDRAEKDLPLVWHPLAYGISREMAEALAALHLPWLTLTPTWERVYPEGQLAAHLLGFVNAEGDGYGLMAYEQRLLRSERQVQMGEVTGSSAPMPREAASDFTVPYPGTSLRLTMDRTIQAYVEGELDKALQDYNAEGGTIIVMDPRTGAILAMASRPAYDPGRYADYSEEEAWRFADPAISSVYEPGSIFKLVTVAAALDSGKVDLDWSYNDVGYLDYGGIRVYNWDRRAYGQQDLQGLLAHSLNVGAATLSTQVLGPQLFYHYVQAFGFGQPTGIELMGEAAGIVHLPSDWNWRDSDLATNAFGQGIAVTPLQMAAATAAIANEGRMMYPYVVAERLYPDGRTIAIVPRQAGQPISPQTARTLSELMARAVELEVPQAQIPGYRIAGKTGTAQIPVEGGYDPEAIIASFVGFGPLPDPQLLVFVKLDRPHVPPDMRWGSQTAAPVFQRVASRLFTLLHIPPGDDAP